MQGRLVQARRQGRSEVLRMPTRRVLPTPAHVVARAPALAEKEPMTAPTTARCKGDVKKLCGVAARARRVRWHEWSNR